MKNVTSIVFLSSLMFGATAFAQSMTYQPQSSATKPAVSDPADTAKSADAPVPGKNSFTESQAKTRLEKHGYTSVSALTKDENSIWHAKALKGGQAVNVDLDYQGNITEQ